MKMSNSAWKFTGFILLLLLVCYGVYLKVERNKQRWGPTERTSQTTTDSNTKKRLDSWDSGIGQKLEKESVAGQENEEDRKIVECFFQKIKSKITPQEFIGILERYQKKYDVDPDKLTREQDDALFDQMEKELIGNECRNL